VLLALKFFQYFNLDCWDTRRRRAGQQKAPKVHSSCCSPWRMEKILTSNMLNNVKNV